MKGLDSTDLGSSWVVRSSMMDKDVNNLASHQSDHFTPLDYSRNHNHRNPNDRRPHQTTPENGIEMVDYMPCNPSPQPQISLDKLSFTDVMQFADFGPKLALHNSKVPGDDDDSSYFLRQQEALMPPLPPLPHLPQPRELDGEEGEQEEDEIMFSESNDGRSSVQFLNGVQRSAAGIMEVKNRRKRPRSLKTTEEVESQRMTHIAVERNRRRQMNDHLRLLRSLMPGSYVQRGDQASIVGGAIEFVRELEQLLQCLESQKRRRLFGGSEPPRAIGVDPSTLPNHQPFFPPLPNGVNDHHMKILELNPNDLIEEMAENKSCLADIEVRLLGCDAMIKILCRKRAGQLLKIVTALEESQFNILHTNVTTIELTVLYSFNVKITAETRYSAEDIAILVEQILSFIDAGTL